MADWISRHLAPHVTTGPAHHDEGERGHRAHQRRAGTGEEDLGQGAGERHEDEARGPGALLHTNARLGSAAAAEPPEIGAVITVMSGLMPRIHPVQRSVVAASKGDRSWMWNGRLT